MFFGQYPRWESNPQNLVGLRPARMPVPSRGQVSGTPDGTRTHTRTDFKSVASSNWATGAYFGWGGRNRTCIVSLPKSDAIPLGDSPSAPQTGIEPVTFCSSNNRWSDSTLLRNGGALQCALYQLSYQGKYFGGLGGTRTPTFSTKALDLQSRSFTNLDTNPELCIALK